MCHRVIIKKTLFKTLTKLIFQLFANTDYRCIQSGS